MEESEGRFNRVYTDLKGRIISGQFPAGSSFLSAEQLRQEYQIGFHTARNVTARLREEGYIVSRNRKAPVVCWEGSVPSTHSAVCEVLSGQPAGAVRIPDGDPAAAVDLCFTIL